MNKKNENEKWKWFSLLYLRAFFVFMLHIFLSAQHEFCFFGYKAEADSWQSLISARIFMPKKLDLPVSGSVEVIQVKLYTISHATLGGHTLKLFLATDFGNR